MGSSIGERAEVLRQMSQRIDMLRLSTAWCQCVSDVGMSTDAWETFFAQRDV